MVSGAIGRGSHPSQQQHRHLGGSFGDDGNGDYHDSSRGRYNSEHLGDERRATSRGQCIYESDKEKLSRAHEGGHQTVRAASHIAARDVNSIGGHDIHGQNLSRDQLNTSSLSRNGTTGAHKGGSTGSMDGFRAEQNPERLGGRSGREAELMAGDDYESRTKKGINTRQRHYDVGSRNSTTSGSRYTEQRALESNRTKSRGAMEMPNEGILGSNVSKFHEKHGGHQADLQTKGEVSSFSVDRGDSTSHRRLENQNSRADLSSGSQNRHSKSRRSSGEGSLQEW